MSGFASDADRLFARIAIQKSFIEPVDVERARGYVQKLGAQSVKLSLGSILQKLGTISIAQLQGVQREMDAASFKCAECGGKGYRLEVGDEGRRCSDCRGPRAEKGSADETPDLGNRSARSSSAAPPASKRTAERQAALEAAFPDLKPVDRRPAGERRADAPGEEKRGEMRLEEPRHRRVTGNTPPSPPPPIEPTLRDIPAVRPKTEPPRPALTMNDLFGPGKSAKQPSKDAPPGSMNDLFGPGKSTKSSSKDPSDEPARVNKASLLGDLPASSKARSGDEQTPRKVQKSPTIPSRPAVKAEDFATLDLPPEEIAAAARLRPKSGATRVPAEHDDPGRTRDFSPSETHDYQHDTRAEDEPKGGHRAEGDDPLVGRLLGGARIERLLGKGGMGSVYRATQVDLDRPIAVKVLAPALCQDPKQVAQFFREAKALAKLEHPNIVTIYSVGKEDEVHFIFMQLIEGGSLEGRLRKSGRLTIEQACAFCKQAAEGLYEAHLKSIVHRDVKPENMLVSGDQLKVTDFGLARFTNEGGIGFSGQIVGTPWYMSPEQIDGRDVDQRADIYALGAMFYYLLTGERPFTGDTPVEILLKHVNDALIPPRERRKEVPEALSRLVCKMMVKGLEGRYQSMKEVLRDLELARRGETLDIDIPLEVRRTVDDIAASAARPLIPEKVVPVRPRSLRWAIVGLVGAAAAIALFLVSPIQQILSADTIAPRPPSHAQREAEDALERVREMLPEKGARATAAALRQLAEDRAGSSVATRALDQARALESKAKQDARDAADVCMASAKREREDRRYGPAIEALHALPASAKGYDLEPALEVEVASIEKECMETLGEAYVPAGEFVFGEHENRVKRTLPGFYIALREVSNADYAPYVKDAHGRRPSTWKSDEPPADSADLPVAGVSFEEARTFARWARKRLPTEMEWEKAARGPDGRTWPWGEEADPARANCLRDARSFASGAEAPAPGLQAVGGHPEGASPFGCLNMAGNVEEWAERVLGDGRTIDPVLKGGGFGSTLVATRAAFYVEALGPTDTHPGVGLRLARELER